MDIVFKREPQDRGRLNMRILCLVSRNPAQYFSLIWHFFASKPDEMSNGNILRQIKRRRFRQIATINLKGIFADNLGIENRKKKKKN